MPDERTRTMEQTYEFLVELSRDTSLPERVRRDVAFFYAIFQAGSMCC